MKKLPGYELNYTYIIQLVHPTIQNGYNEIDSVNFCTQRIICLALNSEEVITV